MKPPAAKSAAPLEQGNIPWLLTIAAATVGPHVEHLPLWLSSLTASLLLWRAWLWRQHAPLPSRWLMVLLVIGGTAGIGWQFRSFFGRDSGVALLALFMALKLLEMHARRDALAVVMLAYFLLLTHYFYSQSIPTGLWLLGSATLITAALIRLYGGAQPVSAIIRYAGLLLAQALPFMLILYLLFPRINGPLWGLPQDAYAGITGLSDKMAPGSMSNLTQSAAIAFRVQFLNGVPEKTDLYWRGLVFDEYDGLTWRAYAWPTQAKLGVPTITASGKTYDYLSTLEPHKQRWLLALDAPVRLPPDSELAPTLTVLNREPLLNRARFAFRSSVDFQANLTESPRILQQALRLPPQINPRSRALAEQWRQASRTPQQIVEAALTLFRQKAFVYTLRAPLLGQHAMDEFLFETKSGFCEHYASAFVFLMRAAGVPARVVAGYQGGELNPVDGLLTIRQSDAHAWAEVWIDKQGWLRVDPTAAVSPERVTQGITAALPASEPLPALVRIDADWLRDLRNRWEAANNAWNQWVLGYNPQRQRELLSRFGLKEPDWRSMTAVLALACGIVLLLTTLWTLYQRNTADPAQRAWRRYCRRLQSYGIRQAVWEGSFAFATRVAQEHASLAAPTWEAAKLYANLRYGQTNKQTQQTHLRLLKQCSKNLPYRWRSKA